MNRWTPEQLAGLNERLDMAAPKEILRWAVGEFDDPAKPSALILTSSFGAESMCTIHLALQVKPEIPVVFINTGYLFPETIGFMEQMRHRFGLRVLEYHTRHDPVVWLTVHGEQDPSRREHVEACCAANKNEPFDRAMKELSPLAWIRGVRADQSDTRAKMRILQWSLRNNCWAISPILRWNPRRIHQYMKQHDLPYHPLWEKRYTSIGCNPQTCTRPMVFDEDSAEMSRQGRWSGLEKKECGLHLEH